MITGSIVALVTPMHPDGAIDWQALARLIELHIESGTAGLGVVGTTGESPTLTVPEHCEVIRFAVEQAGGRIPVVAGTGGNSTHEAIELTVSAAEAGADYSLSVTPYYNRPTQHGLFEHFQAVARAVNLPIILYNVPGRTGCDLLNETVVQLSQIDNIVAIKDATGDVQRGSRLIEAVPDGFAVFSGDDATALELMRHGAKGNVSVTANIAPSDMAAMCNLALTGEWEAAAGIDARLTTLNDLLFSEANPIPVKWAMAHRGMIDSGIRLPLTPLSEACRAPLEKAMETYFA
ncbi:MAG: 4-hydroxy-tetrahydrodipicolinate synthase [Cellvibrionales bacterium TMED122]|nr:4-hydroxy-tetrahydrodipicolinate synthase [Halieaceae bacterium]OUV63500.1 MAG: 4-hydroxy-tetrahydrodipicolinate synthase [Cellvibrionales bacterium TMED122]|tara:strand:+ start:862 stop:1734 length:873 start_codon:yes stop_codon:yes gene_type:complete